MTKTRYRENQIVKALREAEGGRAIKGLCYELGISEATYYNWRCEHGGMETSYIKKLKDLETENQKLKQMYAGLSRDNKAPKEIIENKTVKPTVHRDPADFMLLHFDLSQRAAC